MEKKWKKGKNNNNNNNNKKPQQQQNPHTEDKEGKRSKLFSLNEQTWCLPLGIFQLLSCRGLQELIFFRLLHKLENTI